MTKKHFKAIAEIIRKAKTTQGIDAGSSAEVSIKLADYFQEGNPLFDADKFHKACNP